MTYWIKYIVLGLALAFGYLLLISDSPASISLRTWLAHRLVFSVQPKPEEKPVVDPLPVSSFADALEKSAPSVVSIQTVSKGTLSRNPNPTSYEDQFVVDVGLNVGSGVIVDERGYVVTNYHVVKSASSIKVQLSDGRQKIATLLGFDPISDLALLHIDLDFLPLPLVNAEDEPRAGDLIFAVGNPYGQLDQTITMGIISATRANEVDIPSLQIDAAIHPGNSGGALINAKGEVIGITSTQMAAGRSSAAQTGIGFAIPYAVVKEIVDDLLDDGKVNRGWLGFSASRLMSKDHFRFAPEDIPPGVGFIITELNKDGPAERSGLQLLDYVSHVNGEPVVSFRQISNLILQSRPGDKMEFSVYRQLSPMKIEVTVGEIPSLTDQS